MLLSGDDARLYLTNSLLQYYYSGESLDINAIDIVNELNNKGQNNFFNSNNLLYDKPVLFKNCNSAEYLFRRICNSYTREDGFKTLSIFYEIISELNETFLEKSKLDCATAYITQHIDDSFIDLNVLAQRCGVSKDYFRHLFKQIYGVSPTQYIANQKIVSIKDKLLTSNKSIKEISFLCGFYDENYFSRFFKKHTGLTPNEFRKRYMAMY